MDTKKLTKGVNGHGSMDMNSPEKTLDMRSYSFQRAETQQLMNVASIRVGELLQKTGHRISNLLCLEITCVFIASLWF